MFLCLLSLPLCCEQLMMVVVVVVVVVPFSGMGVTSIGGIVPVEGAVDQEDVGLEDRTHGSPATRRISPASRGCCCARPCAVAAEVAALR
jgi:hypothetical protein